MKKKLGTIVLCTFCILTACAPQGKENIASTAPIETTEATTAAESTTQETTEETTEKTTEASLADLTAMLGIKDDKAKDMLGGGTENKSADGTLLVGRQYETKAMGEDVTIYTQYDDNEAVNLVQVVFAGSESKVYKEAITKSLEIEPEAGGESEGGSTSTIWQKDGKMYTLFRSSGVSTLEIMIPQN